MYKVVIIDDEPIIVEGISRMVPWDKFSCCIAATACDGVEGAEIIRKELPDIIFSDIAMPGLDGLSMVAGLKSEFPHMEISILTGYRDFDYAQKAIRLGVTRYLLKPSSMDEIDEAIGAMTKNLRSKNIMPDRGPMQAAEDNFGEENKTDSAANSFIVNNALHYIEKNYAHKLTLSEVAEKTYISQWHLSKLLNKHMGQNFSEILNHVRIKEAQKLLKDPSLRIGDIAEMVGFVDMAHFSRVFKKIIGTSANEYRNKVSAKEAVINREQ